MARLALSGLSRLAVTAAIVAAPAGGMSMGFGAMKGRAGHHCRVCGCGLKPGKQGRACKECRAAEADPAMKKAMDEAHAYAMRKLPAVQETVISVAKEFIELPKDGPAEELCQATEGTENLGNSALENQGNPE